MSYGVFDTLERGIIDGLHMTTLRLLLTTYLASAILATADNTY